MRIWVKGNMACHIQNVWREPRGTNTSEEKAGHINFKLERVR